MEVLWIMMAAQSLPFPITRFELGNGLRVVVATKEDLPLTLARMVVFAGTRDEGEQWGLAHLTGELLTEGTERYDAEALAEAVEELGAILDVDVGSYTTQITLDVLSPRAREGFDLLQEVILRPTFPNEELNKTRERIIAAIQESLSHPDNVLDDAFHYALYGHHPQGRPPEGTPLTLKSISREDVVRFHRTYYVPANAFLVVVSSLPPEEVRTLVEEAFGDWEGKAPEHPAIPPLPRIEGKKIVVVPMRVNQAFVAMGHFGIRRSDPEYPLVRLMSYVLGSGGFASRLFRIVRSEKGYAYSVNAYFYPGYLLPGEFQAGMQTKIETANDAVASLLEVIRTYRQKGPTPEELRDAQSYALGSLPRQTETFGQILGALVNQTLHNLPDYYWIREAERSQEYTVDQVREAARKYLDVDNFVLVLVVPEDFEVRIPGLEGVSVEKLSVDVLMNWGRGS